MAHGSWGSGWPNCDAGAIDTGFEVSGTRFPGGVRHELEELIGMLVQECKNRGYRFGTDSDPSYGCWGYSCRAISGSNNPSNHSWGLAVDINAPSNPYTSPLVTDMPNWMPDLWNTYGFRWGGDYTGDMDAMHYEFMGSVTDAANETANARAAGIGGGGTDDMPLTDEDIQKIADRVWGQMMEPGGMNQPAWATLIQAHHAAQAAEKAGEGRPDVLSGQSRDEALANTRNDVAALKNG